MDRSSALLAISSPRWDEAPFVLSYRIGEITLFRRRFRGLTLREHFFDLPTDPNAPRPPLERLGRDLDVIVTRSHPVAEPLARLTVTDGALRYVTSQYTRFHTPLGGDFAGYLAKFGSKTRSTLRRKVKRFLELGEGSGMREFKRPQEMEEFHALARSVSRVTYQEKLLDAGLPDNPGFVRELVDLAGRDAVRAYLLLLRGIPIAYLCCPAVNGVLLYSYLGYDPEHAELSPGTVLQYLAFESLFKEQAFRAFDFTEGQGDHKRFFGTNETLCADICYFRLTLAARLWLSAHQVLDRTSAALGRALDRLGLKAAVRRLIRRF
jgi:CelD/BcsL family acetyltransferase involved in cellulose biosynthesis